MRCSSDMYSLSEVAQKLGLSENTIRNMCQNKRFNGAYQTGNGYWLIPEDNFITTIEQNKRAGEILQHKDRGNPRDMADKNVESVDAQEVANYYGVSLKKVVSWIKDGQLSGMQMEGQPEKYLVPKEEFDYLKSKRDKDTTEEEIKKLLGADIDDWEFEIEE